MMALAPWRQPSNGAPAVMVETLAAAVPVLTTARLRLRAPRIGDYPVYARFLLDDASDDEAAWLDFCQLVASWPLRGYGSWTFEVLAGGQALGGIVLNHEYGDPEVELGWTLAEGAEGRGYATEAARAVRDHAFGAMGFETLVSYVDPENARSAAVAARLGARRDPQAEADLNDDIHVFRHHRSPA